MPKPVDSLFAGMPDTVKRIAAVAVVGSIGFGSGAAAVSLGRAEETAALRTRDEAMAADISTNRSIAAENSRRVQDIESILDQANVIDMAERVRRIDRVLCLNGATTQQQRQECAAR